MPRCEPFESPNVMKGKICCQCRTYNGLQRSICRYCGHVMCMEKSKIAIAGEQAKIWGATVTGGVAGFFVGGPVGAIFGAGLGAAIGRAK